MSDDVEEEQTDPNIELPPEERGASRDTRARGAAPLPPPLPGAQAAPAPLPPPPKRPRSSPAWPSTKLPRRPETLSYLSPAPKRGRISSRPPVPAGDVATPLAQRRSAPAGMVEVAAARAAADQWSPSPSQLPERAPSRPPPPMRRDSRPPARLPKPSDPPPAAVGLSPPQRQRIAQMETQLDQARSTMARQRNEIDELRARLEQREARLDEILAALERAPTREVLDGILSDLEERRGAMARELGQRVDYGVREAEAMSGGLRAMEARLAKLEESAEAARIRMRLERVGHQLQGVEGRLEAIEARQDALSAAATRLEDTDRRFERLESLFEELADEVREQREEANLDGLRARMDDVEALVLKSAAAVDAKRDALEEQLARVEEISQSIAPPPPSGDDLTRIRGIGPKYARLLADAGVSAFEQIAAWDEGERDRIAAALGVSTSRIQSAGWIESAKKLASG